MSDHMVHWTAGPVKVQSGAGKAGAGVPADPLKFVADVRNCICRLHVQVSK